MDEKKCYIPVVCEGCSGDSVIGVWKSLNPATGAAAITLPECSELNIVITGNDLRTVNYPIHVIPTQATIDYFFGFNNGETNSAVVRVSKKKVELERFILNGKDVTNAASVLVNYR